MRSINILWITHCAFLNKRLSKLFIRYKCQNREVEHFQQISEIHVSNLTRNQYLFELIFPIKNGVSINMNYELEDYLGQSQTNISSFSVALDWRGNLKWTF